MKIKHLALALVAAAPLLAHATDGYFSHGYGMQAKGMGGASTAVAESAFGAATNPATMAFSGNRFELGLDLFSPRRKASRSGGAPYGLDGAADSDSNLFAIPEIAYNRMVSPNMSLGITVYGNGGMNTDYPGGQLPSPGACGPATGPGTGFNPQPGPYNLLCGNGSLGVAQGESLDFLGGTLGLAYITTGGNTAFSTATAVPEPSTDAALAGLGVFGLAVWRKRAPRNAV